jgi:hypothetical protein
MSRKSFKRKPDETKMDRFRELTPETLVNQKQTRADANIDLTGHFVGNYIIDAPTETCQFYSIRDQYGKIHAQCTTALAAKEYIDNRLNPSHEIQF